MNSRRTAAFAVARWLATHEFSDTLLPQSGPDRAFVQDMVYTVIRRFRTLRFVLGELMEKWPKGELEALLLTGAAQLMYMDDVPDFAAVNETVAAAKMSGGGRRLDRVVNGVLRNLARRREELAAKVAAAPLGLRESYPDALVARWTERYGAEGAEKLARWHNEPAETWLYRIRDGEFERLPRGQKVTDVPGYSEGAFTVADPATANAVGLMDLHEGMNVLDFCAAPGGKTVQMAVAVGASGHVVAQEVNPKRLRLLEENVRRTRLANVKVVASVADAGEPSGTPLFDRVLADVPCSNTGVLRRRPDARWRWSRERLERLVELQRRVFAAAAAHVAAGGMLVYSTCSNEPEENDAQVRAFLAGHPDFSEVARRESVPFESGHDGAFSCALARR